MHLPHFKTMRLYGKKIQLSAQGTFIDRKKILQKILMKIFKKIVSIMKLLLSSHSNKMKRQKELNILFLSLFKLFLLHIIFQGPYGQKLLKKKQQTHTIEALSISIKALPYNFKIPKIKCFILVASILLGIKFRLKYLNESTKSQMIDLIKIFILVVKIQTNIGLIILKVAKLLL